MDLPLADGHLTMSARGQGCRLGDKAKLAYPILPLESTDEFMKECAAGGAYQFKVLE